MIPVRYYIFIYLLSAGMLANAGIIGDIDERLDGSYNILGKRLGDTATHHMSRALRITFPVRGALAVTGTPLCFGDIVLTVAHVNNLNGAETASPRGLRVSLPDLTSPGYFSAVYAVSDYMLANSTRRYKAAVSPRPSDDFMLLKLSRSLPSTVTPLLLPALTDSGRSISAQSCDWPTVNVAYHYDLGYSDGSVRRSSIQPGSTRFKNAGRVPLMTVTSEVANKDDDSSLFGDWYLDPKIAFTAHDTQATASGSAIVCPILNPLAKPAGEFIHKGHRSGDKLQGIVVGQTRVVKPGDDSMRNVITNNIGGIYESLAKLKGLSIEQVESLCGNESPASRAN